MDWLFLIVVLALVAFLNLSLLWNRIASRTYVMLEPENLIRHVFWFYTWRAWYWGKRRARSIWAWCKHLLKGIKKNPAIGILATAWACIVLSVIFFGYDISVLYNELSKQIMEGEKDADEYRGIAIRYFGIIAGVGAVIGYIIAIARNITANNQNKINEQGQITESMVQAITQIGAVNGDKPNIEVRLGGLYSLQRIMQDSPRDELSIAKIFYAYVRENITRDKSGQPEQKDKNGNKSYKLPEDIKAVLGIISEFSKERKVHGKWPLLNLVIPTFDLSHADFSNYSLIDIDFSRANLEQINLSGTDLMNADLSGTNLSGADLSYANLFDTDLSDADLSDADLKTTIFHSAHLNDTVFHNADLSGNNLTRVDFSYADISLANLSGADLAGVKLTGKDLVDTDLFGANLSRAVIVNSMWTNANLEQANLCGANLTGGLRLEQEQINKAYGDVYTKLPEGLIHPDHWKK